MKTLFIETGIEEEYENALIVSALKFVTPEETQKYYPEHYRENDKEK